VALPASFKKQFDVLAKAGEKSCKKVMCFTLDYYKYSIVCLSLVISSHHQQYLWKCTATMPLSGSNAKNNNHCPTSASKLGSMTSAKLNKTKP